MLVERVYHRTRRHLAVHVVGRPPQEDAMFSRLIHELVGPVIPRAIPGVHAVHAVEAAGVHPLLLAAGSERYVPYQDPGGGRGNCSPWPTPCWATASCRWPSTCASPPPRTARDLDVRHVPGFLRHVLERVDWRRDLHFQTCTTMDTLDYSGRRLNEGSKVVIAAAGPPLRTLPVGVRQPPGPARTGGVRPAAGVPARHPRAWKVRPGRRRATAPTAPWIGSVPATIATTPINAFPLVVIVDHSDFAARTLDNFLWTTFTRSDPATDIYGIESFLRDKHWGCFGSLVIDARTKPNHAPPLEEDPAVTNRVDALAARGGPLHGII